MKKLMQKLMRIRSHLIMLVFLFWVTQFIGWMLMMLYVQFFDQQLGKEVLYVTQISHWALVEAAGTAVLSSWTLLAAHRNAQHIKHLHEHVDPHDASPIDGPHNS